MLEDIFSCSTEGGMRNVDVTLLSEGRVEIHIEDLLNDQSARIELNAYQARTLANSLMNDLTGHHGQGGI